MSQREQALKRHERKASRPFEFNRDDRDTNIQMAAIKVEDAINHLESAMLGARDWSDYETMMYFKKQLADWLSNDNGEAGFDPYVNASHAEAE